jgi:hypothetical protein
MLRKCPSDKIYNPNTGNCVKLSSNTGMLVRLAELEEKLKGYSDIDNIKETITNKIHELEKMKVALDNKTTDINKYNDEINSKLQQTVKDLEKANKNVQITESDNIKLLRKVSKLESQLNELVTDYDNNKNVIDNLLNERDSLTDEILKLKSELESANARTNVLTKYKEKTFNERNYKMKCESNQYYHPQSKKCINKPICRDNEWYSHVTHSCKKIQKNDNITNQDIQNESSINESNINESSLNESSLNNPVEITEQPEINDLKIDEIILDKLKETSETKKETELEKLENIEINENKDNINKNCEDNEYYNFKLGKCMPKVCPPGKTYNKELKKCIASK